MNIFTNLFKWIRLKRKAVVIPRITARVIIEKKGRYLFLLQTEERGGRLSLPGGGIKQKESIRKGLVREVKEETNLLIRKKDLVPVHTHYRRKKQELEVVFFFKITIDDLSDLALNEPEKFSDFIWYSKNYIPENMIPECKTALINIDEGIIFSERRKKKSKKKFLPQEVMNLVLTE